MNATYLKPGQVWRWLPDKGDAQRFALVYRIGRSSEFRVEIRAGFRARLEHGSAKSIPDAAALVYEGCRLARFASWVRDFAPVFEGVEEKP